MPGISRLSVEEVLTVRRQMGQTRLAARDAFGQVEPLDMAKLEMAVNRQGTSGAGEYKYDTVADVAATLFFGIAMDHAFENGNKRTALVATLVFLDKNRHLLIEANEDELYELARQLAAHELPIAGTNKPTADDEVRYLSRWIRSRMRLRVLGDHSMKFPELRRILEELGCRFEKPSKNYIKIVRDKWTYRAGYPNPGFEVQVPEIKAIRHALRLDDAHGVDSAGFYNLKGQVDRFVNQHRNLLKRLADL